MSNRRDNTEKDSLLDAIKEIESSVENGSKEDNPEIVDIMTFCNHPAYLNLPGNNFRLYDSQKIILKCFYTGSRGNENLTLTKEDWEWLYANAEDEERDGTLYEKNMDQVIEKIRNRIRDNFTFKELCLVLGRRSGKTILASIISAYEVYKLLVINNGDPHAYYNLPYDDEIAVINVALSQQQAGRLFGQIQSRLRNSPFFKNRIAKETTSEIRLYTDSDLEKKKKGTILSIHGSVMILCGHSNPDTLAGYSAILILFDELAFYDDSGKVTGSYFYNRLKPSLAKFLPKGDGRLVEISSPNNMNGVFYDIFRRAKDTAKEARGILSFQLPTWVANPEIEYANEDLVNDRIRTPEAFAIEYGAQWAKTGSYSKFFEEGLIERCIRHDAEPHMSPKPKMNYYLHVDPASSHDRYVAVLVAKQHYKNHLGEKRIRNHLANIWVWDPQPGVGIQYHLIDKEIIDICRKFHVLLVTYDDYQSHHSMQLLRSKGIRASRIPYNRSMKMRIYQNLLDMMSYEPVPELWIYDDNRLVLEMKALRKKPTQRGYTLVKDKDGVAKTDDVVDCLAGACASASETMYQPLPRPTTVRMGYS